MAFKCEMSAGYEMDFGIGQVALEGFGTFRDERRVVLSPDTQQWGLFQYSLRALSQRHVYPQGHAEVYGAYIELDVLILVRA